MAYRILQTTALTAALLVGGAMAARAAPDDEIKYRDGKPVSQTETTQSKAGGAAGMQGAPDDQIKYRDGKPVGGAMAGESPKPAKKSMTRASSKTKSMKKTSMKRKPGMKRNSSM